ncbi:BLOC-1 related complex subunit 6 [Haemaphysalis longicornis]
MDNKSSNMSVENGPPNPEYLDNRASRADDDEGRADGGAVSASVSGDEEDTASPSVSASIDGGGGDSDEMPDAMTASYSEICLEGEEDDDLLPGEICDLAEVQDATQGINELVDQIHREEREAAAARTASSSRPQSLAVSRQQQQQSGSRLPAAMTDSQVTTSSSLAEEVFEDSHAGAVASGLSELPGTLTYEGDMVTFVAEDLQQKIKLSSPTAKVTTDPFLSSCSSLSSVSRLGVVDPGALADLEAEARTVAASVETLLDSLTTAMHGVSSLTVDCMQLYERGITRTCDMADSDIKAMYQVMAKFEELTNSMRPLDGLVAQVKGIKKLLDHFENAVEGKT